MKKILTMLAAVLLTIQMAGAQAIFKINQYNIIYNKVFMPVGTLFTNYPFGRHISIASYFYVNAWPRAGSWGEGLAGPVWTPVMGISVGLLAGFQSNEDHIFRFSPIALVNRDRFSFLGQRYVDQAPGRRELRFGPADFEQELVAGEFHLLQLFEPADQALELAAPHRSFFIYPVGALRQHVQFVFLGQEFDLHSLAHPLPWPLQ